MFEVSAIITTHAEGELIRASVKSCQLAISELVSKVDVTVELIIAMDRPSSTTKNIVSDYSDVASLVEFDFGDQGLSLIHI